jgi:hypothetical protein
MAQAPFPSGPNQADPLSQLRDIHLPAPVEAWPPAPGWWALGIIAAILAIAGIAWLVRWWMKNRYRREGLKQLEALRAKHEADRNDAVYLAGYSELLKRVALTHFPRNKVASLTGEAWVQFLDRAANTDEFRMGPGQALINGNYAPDPEVDVEALHRLGTFWIKNHRAEAA